MRDNTFFQAICRVGIFMICAQAMVHFRPQEAYEKYLKLLVSVMVLIQLFLPIGGFLFRGGGQEAARLLEQFQRDLEQDMREAAESAEAADALLEQLTLEEVMRRLEEQQESVTGSSADEAGQSGPQNREMSGEQESREEAENREVPEGQENREEAGNREVPEGQENREEAGNREVPEGQENPAGSRDAGEISVDVREIEPIVIRIGEG